MQSDKMKIPFFKNKDLEDTFQKNGFVKVGKLNENSIKELIQWNQRLNIPDAFGFGYNVGMNAKNYELRKKMREVIIEIVFSEIKELLNSRIPYTASYMNKNTSKFAFVSAHQDWTFTDEAKIDSVMCWIPLIDVSINNAALGFIPYSNSFYDYVRAFPFNILKTPVFVHQEKLMHYIDIMDMKAGEIVFFNQKTIHGSFANYSNSERQALSMSFVHSDYDIYTYICNPNTKGKTMLKYKVPIDFMVTTNYPIIASMYHNNHINLETTLVDEVEVKLPSNKWEDLEQILTQHNIGIKQEQVILTQRMQDLRINKKESIWTSIKNKLKSN